MFINSKDTAKIHLIAITSSTLLIAQTNSIAATPAACRAAHPGAEWRCLLTNETLKYGVRTTPLFLAQQVRPLLLRETKAKSKDSDLFPWPN